MLPFSVNQTKQKLNSRKSKKYNDSDTNKIDCVRRINSIWSIPSLNMKPKNKHRYNQLNAKLFSTIYDQANIVIVRGYCDTISYKASCLLQDIYAKHSSIVEESWCIENFGQSDESLLKPYDILNQIDNLNNKKLEEKSWYASFILECDALALSNVLKDFPVKTLAPLFMHPLHQTRHSHPKKIKQSNCIWFFFGRHTGVSRHSVLKGRPEHTDSVSNSGTWHIQMNGKKVWYLRPTKKLIDDTKKKGIHLDVSKCYRIECHPGDLLLLNTRLWFHRTEIPCTRLAKEEISFSYARDIFITPDPKDYITPHDQEESNINLPESPPCNMTNIDAFYVSRPISKGTVILTEDELPDFELPRTQNIDQANCEVMFGEDGIGLLVARKNIKPREYLYLYESENENESE